MKAVNLENKKAFLKHQRPHPRTCQEPLPQKEYVYSKDAVFCLIIF